MKIFNVFAWLLLFCPWVTLGQQSSLSNAQRATANVYVKFLSYQTFVTVCGGIDDSQDLAPLFTDWQQANQAQIDQGQKILRSHYESNNLNFKKTFDTKLLREKSYFDSLNLAGQKEHCHKLAYYLQSH